MYCFCFDKKSEINPVAAGRFVAVNPNLHSKRVLTDAVILLGVEGECSMAQDNREYTLCKGDCMVLFPQHEHKGTAFTRVGQSHFWCHFSLPDGFYISKNEDLKEPAVDNICVLPEFYHIDDYQKFFILFSQLIDACNDEEHNEAISECYLKILLYSLALEYSKGSNNEKQKVASRLKNWAEINDYNELSVAAASKALGYNSNYFSRIIKNETGLSPIEYINFLKLKRAKNLLLNSNMKIREIALYSGFADEKYFIKVFKKYERLTPSGFREAYFRKNINIK